MFTSLTSPPNYRNNWSTKNPKGFATNKLVKVYFSQDFYNPNLD